MARSSYFTGVRLAVAAALGVDVAVIAEVAVGAVVLVWTGVSVASGVLVASGVSLATANLVLFGLLVGLWLLQHRMILAEERSCREKYGARYLRYAERVARYLARPGPSMP